MLLSCAPVIRKDLMEVAIRNVPLSEVKKNPDVYKSKLFVVGGIIVDTKATAEGSLVEALYVPVDSKGYLKSVGMPHVRFLALLPKKEGFLDPIIFKSDRHITVAGDFEGIRKGKIGEMEYGYPFFVIKEIHLWREEGNYYYPYYYEPYYAPYPYWWDYPYWGWGYPWWRSGPPPYWW